MSEIEIYQSEDGAVELNVQLENETVWLSQAQMVELFGRDKSVISRHIRNIYATEELSKEATVAKIATVQQEGSRAITREIDFYNLDMIISVGYRVNSKRGIQFRQWVTQTLKQHLVKGYTLNQKRLQNNMQQFEEAVEFEGIIRKIYQTFGGDDLIEGAEAKAAHLLYYIIKDHPFNDGNKRIGAFMFILFLAKNDLLCEANGTCKINDNALTTLALLIAQSDPKSKRVDDYVGGEFGGGRVKYDIK